MKRFIVPLVLVLMAGLMAEDASAQVRVRRGLFGGVRVRAPGVAVNAGRFVRVRVRAPFVNVRVGSRGFRHPVVGINRRFLSPATVIGSPLVVGYSSFFVPQPVVFGGFGRSQIIVNGGFSAGCAAY